MKGKGNVFSLFMVLVTLLSASLTAIITQASSSNYLQLLIYFATPCIILNWVCVVITIKLGTNWQANTAKVLSILAAVFYLELLGRVIYT